MVRIPDRYHSAVEKIGKETGADEAMGRYTSRGMDVSGRYPMMYPRDGYSYGYPDE